MTGTAFPENVSYKDHVMFNKQEIERRLQSRLHMPGVETAPLEALNYTDPVAIIDAGIGFDARTLRLFLQRLAPPNAGVTTGPSIWNTFGHRHTCEAVIYFLTGEGFSIIDGVRYDWKAGDFLCVPVFPWHRHVNTTDEPVLRGGRHGPLSKAVGLSVFEDELYPDQWIFARRGTRRWAASSRVSRKARRRPTRARSPRRNASTAVSCATPTRRRLAVAPGGCWCAPRTSLFRTRRSAAWP